MRLASSYLVALLSVAVLAASAWAQSPAGEPAPAPSTPAPSTPAPSTPAPSTPPPVTDAAERARTLGVPPVPPVRPKNIDNYRKARPSGFWTSTRPAKGGSYRYRLLAIGVVIFLIMLGFMLWAVKRYSVRDAPQ